MNFQGGAFPQGTSGQQFDFRSVDGRAIGPHDWLRVWAALYPAQDYGEYGALISTRAFSSDDFVRISKWKDGATTAKQWKPNTASVAYVLWMQIAQERPTCPTELETAAFLNDWSHRRYRDEYANGTVRDKEFGLSRATTLLHFLSRGRYPIFDSRVRCALKRLLHTTVRNTVEWYLERCCPLVAEIAAVCGADTLRTVDMALFAYGGRKLGTLDCRISTP